MRQSKLGIVSILFAVAAVAASVLMVQYMLVANDEHGLTANMDKLNAALRASGLAAKIAGGLGVAGLVLGIAGLRSGGRGTGTSIVGVVLNGVITLAFALILATYVAAEMSR